MWTRNQIFLCVVEAKLLHKYWYKCLNWLHHVIHYFSLCRWRHFPTLCQTNERYTFNFFPFTTFMSFGAFFEVNTVEKGKPSMMEFTEISKSMGTKYFRLFHGLCVQCTLCIQHARYKKIKRETTTAQYYYVWQGFCECVCVCVSLRVYLASHAHLCNEIIY